MYLHNNQVGQVQYAFNSDGQMIYERTQTPFGETMGELNAYNLHMPVRFPGQHYDAETGFNQNWNRDYDPSLGRYVQSDPIGLGGGINIYGYAYQSPAIFVDPEGKASLWWLVPPIAGICFTCLPEEECRADPIGCYSDQVADAAEAFSDLNRAIDKANEMAETGTDSDHSSAETQMQGDRERARDAAKDAHTAVQSTPVGGAPGASLAK